MLAFGSQDFKTSGLRDGSFRGPANGAVRTGLRLYRAPIQYEQVAIVRKINDWDGGGVPPDFAGIIPTFLESEEK